MAIEISGFTLSPFYGDPGSLPTTQTMVIYPNFNWTYSLKRNYFLKFNVGILLPYEKEIYTIAEPLPNGQDTGFYDDWHFKYQNTFLPFAGIEFGRNYIKSSAD